MLTARELRVLRLCLSLGVIIGLLGCAFDATPEDDLGWTCSIPVGGQVNQCACSGPPVTLEQAGQISYRLCNDACAAMPGCVP